MARERLIELERRWRESGDATDGVRYVRERVRQGDSLEDLDVEQGALLLRDRVDEGELDEDQLRLAAYAGLAAARVALGPEAPQEVDDPERIGEWAEGLAPWNVPVLFQAALAGARLVATRLEGSGEDEEDAGPALVEAIEAWVADPEARRARAVALAAETFRGWETEDDEDVRVDALRSLDLLADAVAVAQKGEPSRSVAFTVGDALQAAVQAVSPKRLNSAARRAVLAHALRPRPAAKVKKGKARPYAPNERFQSGEVIEHPKFGKGTVEAVSGKQIEVEFVDGARRKLAHGLG